MKSRSTMIIFFFPLALLGSGDCSSYFPLHCGDTLKYGLFTTWVSDSSWTPNVRIITVDAEFTRGDTQCFIQTETITETESIFSAKKLFLFLAIRFSVSTFLKMELLVRGCLRKKNTRFFRLKLLLFPIIHRCLQKVRFFLNTRVIMKFFCLFIPA